MTSRDTSDACMPSWPIEIPSLTAMVMNSIGNPPASRTPSFDFLASRSSGMLQGVTSFHDEHTPTWRSEEHTSELQSLMRISYAVFCLKKKKKNVTDEHT